MIRRLFARFLRFWRDDVAHEEGTKKVSEQGKLSPETASERPNKATESSHKEVVKVPESAQSHELDAHYHVEPHSTCLNCHTPIYGKYCTECGQRDLDLKRPLWSLLMELTDNYFSWEGKMLKTLGPLLFMPGYLTKSFFSGHRARYLPPIRLYVLASILFFITVNFTNIAILKIDFVPKERATEKVVQDQDTARTNARQALEQSLASPNLPPAVRQSLEAKLKDLEQLETAPETPVPPKTDSPKVTVTGVGSNGDQVITLGDVDWDFDMKMFAPIEDTGTRYVPESLFEEARANLNKEIDEAKAKNEEDSDLTIRLVTFARDVMDGISAASERPERLNNALNDWVSRSLLLLLPLFALLLWVFYWGAGEALIKQMIFSLHFHTYIFLVLTLLITIEVVFKAGLDEWMFYAAVPLYLFIALKVSSGNGWIRTIFKFIFIAITYFMVFMATLSIALALSLSQL